MTEPTHTVVVRAEATDTDSIEARIEHAGEPSPELLADLTLSAADTFERVHGRKPSRVLVEVLPWGAADTDKGDLRSQGVRAEGARRGRDGYERRACGVSDDPRRATAFYGSCPKCGAGYWADVTTATMCGPTLNVVCQRHVPVGDVELLNAGMFSRDDREAWDRWRVADEA
jgi:hypothetical protein